jgi:hypothetical protein
MAPTKKVGTEFSNAAQSTHVNKPGEISIKELSSVELISPAGKKLAAHSAPASAFEADITQADNPLKTGSFDAPPLTPVHMSSRRQPTGTIFTSETTNHNPEPTLPLMTEKSRAAAKRAAPRNAYSTKLGDK